jgi:uncharacterized membrane protein
MLDLMPFEEQHMDSLGLFAGKKKKRKEKKMEEKKKSIILFILKLTPNILTFYIASIIFITIQIK